jgi:ferredoxin-NADP reductase/uncharacterized protein YcbX
MMSKREPFLSRILIFPIKSLDPVEVRQAQVLSSGALEHDRTWALFEENGKFVNGKRHAAVHRLRSQTDIAASAVTLSDENRSDLGSKRFSIDEDAGALEGWLAAYFGFPVAFRKNSEGGFPDDTESPGPTIISVATLAEIGRWFGLPIDEVRRRFRSNIEIDGVPPFWEDRLFGAPGTTIRFRIGDVIFEGINPCQRCVVPPRDPLTGENDDTFVRRFTELRARTLPPWSTRERFNHFYRVAINTRPHGDQSGKSLRVGERVEILDLPVESTAQPTGASDFWAGDLIVESVRDETATVRTFRLRHPSGSGLPFRFQPGQFLTVSIGDATDALQRCYTIASSPSEAAFCEITVKREGIGSTALHESFNAGSRLSVSGPMGRFIFDGEASAEIVLIAGGVGITPLMSKIRYLVSRGWAGRIDLIYSVKTPRDIIFRDELAQLQGTFPALKVYLTVTSGDDVWTGARGRLSPDFIRAAVPDIAIRTVHICGPTAMAASVQQMLHHLGVELSQIEVEAFGAAKADRAPRGDAIDYEVTFARSALTTTVSSRTTLLDAALAAGIALDHGCRAGVCGRCKAKLLSGEVAIDCDFALTPEQKDARLILTCQAHAAGPVSLDA